MATEEKIIPFENFESIDFHSLVSINKYLKHKCGECIHWVTDMEQTVIDETIRLKGTGHTKIEKLTGTCTHFGRSGKIEDKTYKGTLKCYENELKLW